VLLPANTANLPERNRLAITRWVEAGPQNQHSSSMNDVPCSVSPHPQSSHVGIQVRSKFAPPPHFNVAPSQSPPNHHNLVEMLFLYPIQRRDIFLEFHPTRCYNMRPTSPNVFTVPGEWVQRWGLKTVRETMPTFLYAMGSTGWFDY
jgi:hypothetical protein